MDTLVNRYVDRGGCSQLVGFISANLNHQTHPLDHLSGGGAFRSILMDLIWQMLQPFVALQEV